MNTALTPTQEQQAIIKMAESGASLRIKAFAGAAKSSTLIMIAERFEELGGRVGMYLAFNKAIATEAETKFPSSVECRTVHSLAYKYTPAALKKKISYEKILSKQYAHIYNFTNSWVNDNNDQDRKRVITTGAKWTMVTRTINRYCQSADSELSRKHVGLLDWMLANHSFDLDALKSEVYDIATKHWNDIIDPDSKVPLTHDAYLKLFSEKGKVLPVQYLMIDEAQDSSPVILKLISKLECQKFYVGDDYQSIYQWLGAINAMERVGGDEMYLTKSFRFGDNIAHIANILLKYAGCDIPLVGNGKTDGVTYCTSPDGWMPDAVICRTNSGVVENIFQYANDYPNLSIGASFDAQSIYKFVEAYLDVCDGVETIHPLLSPFKSKQDVLDYCEDNVDDVEVINIVSMIERYGASTVMSAVKRCETNRKPTLMITTAHKSKGLEWDRVKMHNDFRIVGKEGLSTDAQEINLLYVACTRAKKDIDVGGILLGLDMIASKVGEELPFVTEEASRKLQDELISKFKRDGFIPVSVTGMASFDKFNVDKDFNQFFKSRIGVSKRMDIEDFEYLGFEESFE